MKFTNGYFTTLALALLLAPGLASAEGPDWMRGNALNVVLSINHVDEMRAFYGEVLGLEALSDLNLPPREGRPMAIIMVRYKIGNSQIKMLVHSDLSRLPGGRATANGLRGLSIPITDGYEIAKRVEEASGTVIEWIPAEDHKVGLVRDPDDNEIELRWYAKDAAPEKLARMELALTVADLDASRRHYGEWLGLPELPGTDLAGYEGTVHRYQVGESVLRVWSPGKSLPTETGWTKDGYGLRYVQFIVRDAYALHEHLVSVGAGIAQGPTPLGRGAVLLFGKDPDGVINECVGPPKANP